jgi:hypothetical protein
MQRSPQRRRSAGDVCPGVLGNLSRFSLILRRASCGVVVSHLPAQGLSDGPACGNVTRGQPMLPDMKLRPPKPPLSDGTVTLRELAVADVPAVTTACRDPEIVRWTTEIPEGYTEEHARGWIESAGAGWENGRGEFAITERRRTRSPARLGSSSGKSGLLRLGIGWPRHSGAMVWRLGLWAWWLIGATASGLFASSS